MDQVMAVRSALLHAAGGNLWQPIDFNAGAIGRAFGGDAEVNQALEQLLVPGQRDQVCGVVLEQLASMRLLVWSCQEAVMIPEDLSESLRLLDCCC